MTRRSRTRNGWYYRAEKSTCRACPLRERCAGSNSSSRAVVIVEGYEALLRARRRHRRWDTRARSAYQRHRWKVEGVHGESNTQHGLRRAVRHNLANVAIQAYLTAAVINLKRLAAAASHHFTTVLELLRASLSGLSHQEPSRFKMTNKMNVRWQTH